MKNLLLFRTLKRWLSRLSSLLLMFQKSPLVQMLFPQANFLASSAAMNSTGFAIATVVGLGAYDSVAGATVVSQLLPSENSPIVPVTAGSHLAAVFQVTGGIQAAPQSWSVTSGSLPAGLILANPQGETTTTLTGTTTEIGSFPVTITAWQDSDFSGSAAHGNFTIQVSVGTPAAIGTHPASTTINSGNTATLTVTATGSAPFTYQWYQGASGETTAPVGPNSASFTTPVLTATTSYWVRVTNNANPSGANSNAATVTVRQPAAISTHPASTSVDSGQSTTLTVVATGDPPLSYQWYQGASGVTTTPVGTNASSFNTPALTAAASYWVKVSNIANPGGANSNTATVSIRQPAAIVTHPVSVAVNTGESTTLTVVASGDEPLTYQWYEGASGVTTTPVGTNSSSFTTPALSATTSYWVNVSNPTNPTGAASLAAKVTVLLVTPPYAHAMSDLPETVASSRRDQPNTTWFGWSSFNEPGARDEPINDGTPDIGTTMDGANFHTTNGEDHVVESGEFSFATGSLAEQIVVPTDGVVGPDGFTTIILQITAPPTTGPFPGPILLGSIDGVAPTVVQGVNNAGDGQLWVKWQLPGNQASYAIDLAGAPGQTGFELDIVMVDTSFSETGYLPDSMAAQPPVITTASPLPLAVVGTPYHHQFSGEGGTGPREFVVSAGVLPLGLTLGESGVLSGTPLAAGTANFTVMIVDANVLTATKAFALPVVTAPVISTSASLPPGVVGTAYNLNLAVTGGTAPFEWTLGDGSLPGGLTLSSAGALSGTPAAAGTANFSVQVEDANGLVNTQSFSMSVSSLAITTLSLPTAVKGVAYSHALGGAGGTPPYTWEIIAGTPPTGITLSTAGVLSGTPTLPGNASLTFRVTDATSFSVTKQLALPVSGAFIAPVIQPIVFPTVTIGTQFSHTVTALNYPKTFTISGLPAGLKATAATGVIAGRPSVSGVFNVQVRATNSGGASTVVTARLTVKALDRNLVGAFSGLIARDPIINRNLGGSLTVTTTSNGSFSVKLISALPNSAAKAASASYAATGFLAATAPQLSVPVGGQTLALTFDTGTGLVTGTLGAAAVTGWRNVWNAQLNPADSLQGYYSFALDLADQADSGVLTIPQGTGFATFSVNASGGLAIAGKTADGETITTATFLGPNGQFWLYTPLYKNLGSLQGLLNVTEDSEGLFAGNNISGALTWFKPAAPTSRAYPGTFGPINLLAEGAYLAPASKGNIVLGLPEAGPVNLSFTDGGLANSVTDPDTTFTYTHDNKVVLSAAAANPGKIAITINAATGAVSGNFSLEETAPPLKRAKVPFHGQVVRLANGSVKAAGYFMLGQIPGQGETAAKAPLLSGGFSLWQTVD